MGNSLVTIIILHWQNFDMTSRCLKRVQHIDYEPYQVILVDNGSTNDSLVRLRQAFPDVQILALPENRGFAGGVNPAIQQALQQGSDYIFLLNNDALVSPDILTKLVAVQRQTPSLGIVNAKPVYEHRPDRLAGVGCSVQRYTTTTLGWDEQDTFQGREEPLFVDAIFGCTMLIPRRTLETIGLFDERFFFYYEDVDLCLRTRNAGFQVACFPGVVVQHAVAASSRHVRGLREFYMARSRQLFFRKYRRGAERIVYTLIEIVQALRMVRAKIKHAEYADALGYMAGALVGLVVPPPLPHAARVVSRREVP